MSEHTPGPWRVEDPFGPNSLAIVEAGKESYQWRFIATISDDADEADDIGPQESMANARLIAAAPELLDALREASRYLEYLGGSTAGTFVGPGTPTEALAQANAAIAKATGKAPREQVSEEDCPGHVASDRDPMICGRCGVHVDSLRPPEPEDSTP